MSDNLYRDGIELLDPNAEPRFFEVDDDDIIGGSSNPLNPTLEEGEEISEEEESSTQSKELEVEEEGDVEIDTDEDIEEEEDSETEPVEEKPKSKKQGRPKKEEAPEVDYTVIASILKDEGIFTKYEPKEGEDLGPDDIIEGIEEEIKALNAQWIEETESELNSLTGGLIEHLKAGGSPEDWVSKVVPTSYENFDIKTLDDNEVAAEQVLREAYKRRRYKKGRIEKLITRAKDVESLIEDAKEEVVDLIEEDKINKEEYAKKRIHEEQQRQQDYKEAVKSVYKLVDEADNFIPNVNTTKKVRKQIKDKIVNRNVTKKMSQDPLKYEVNLAVLDHYGLLDLDFSKIMTDLETTAAKSTKRQIIKTTSKKDSNARKTKNSKEAGDIMKDFKRSLVK